MLITGRSGHSGGTLAHVPLTEFSLWLSVNYTCVWIYCQRWARGVRRIWSLRVRVNRCWSFRRERFNVGRAGHFFLVAMAIVIRIVIFWQRWCFPMNFHMLSQRTRMGVTFVASAHLAVVRFIARVNVTMLLPVGAVGKATVASFKLTFEWFFTWK